MDNRLLEETEYLLRENNIRPGFVAGQNFLICGDVLDDIITAGAIDKKDNVLEIGPGLGVLTSQLIKKANKVLAIEYDKQLIPLLNKFVKINDNLELINDDILNISNEDIADKLNNEFRVIANIPYQITAKIIKKFLNFEPKPTSLILLVQKEVAERIVAGPGNLSKLAISVQFYAKAEIIRVVSKTCFWPEPKVDSAIVTVKNISRKNFKSKEEENLFFEIIKSGFAHKRKVLIKNLEKSKSLKFLEVGLPEIKELFEKLGINPKIRAEDISLEIWLEITKYFSTNL